MELLIIGAVIAALLLYKKGSAALPDERITVTETGSYPHSIAFNETVRKWRIPLRLIVAIVDHESSFNSKAINYEKKADIAKGHDVDSIGLGQILYPDTALALDPFATRDKLMNAQYNLDLTGKLLSQLLSRYPHKRPDGFYPDAVSAYNAGSLRYDADGMYRNQAYVDAVESTYYKWSNLTNPAF
jgi:Soluble lytic murein transglycosylase and related regulatory proteins (some contain LysM/invasin domains)